MKRHSQQGSALLIVLGFLSFMVVSAVAFAIWMRTERMPSSALRRNVANRYLVKAALAQAMSRVDDAIRSHPYPGAWNTNNQDVAYHDGNGSAYDWWVSRVFMPPNPTPEDGGATLPGNRSSRFAPISKTVSVLNLEALGYLPPAIANDVRLLSRSSWAAKWDYFNFDAGRYAFCAVDVSDMLDINKISADSPRTSAAAARFDPNAGGDKKPPASRYSLAYLFRDDANFSSVSVPSEFDKIVHERDGLDWPEAPLVSLMDYNLALGDKLYGGWLWSPFYYLISGKNPSGNLYAGNGETRNVKGARRQPFITDSWFPQNHNETKIKQYDIGEYQPFDTTERTSLKDVERKMKNDNQFWVKMYREGFAFCRLDPMMLSDYLDVDNVPLSLAMPCVERVPMITTLGPVGKDVKIEFIPDANPSKTDTKDDEKWEYYDVKIRVTPPKISAGLIFPFKTGSGDDSRNFTVESLMRLVFVDEGKDPKPDEPLMKSLRNSELAQILRPQNESEWKDVADSQQFVSPDDNKPCLFLSLFGTAAVNENMLDVQNVSEMVDRGTSNMHPLGTPVPREGTILQKIKVTKIKKAANGNMVEDPSSTTYRYQILMSSFKTDGTVVNVPDQPMEEADFNSFCLEHNIRPYLISWTRVKDDKEKKTVDMVPATYQDDLLNTISNDDAPEEVTEFLGNDEAKGQPILYFPGRTTFTYANANVKENTSLESEWLYKSCYVVDPRYNWAPENWWFSDEENPTVQKWYEAVFNEGGILDTLAQDDPGNVPGNPRGDRARDPFLFVSNSGYLQSIGELAFLPHLSEIDNTTISESVLNAGAYKGEVHKVVGGNYEGLKTMPCARAAWRSYQNYRTNPNAFEFGANFYRRGLVNAPQGFYVNPFTQEREVMLAAIAHTPLNYWVAGTNDTGKVEGKKKREKFAAADTFDADTQYRSDYLAEYMMHRFEDLSRMMTFKGAPSGEESYMIRKVWEDLFDALDWGGRCPEGTTVQSIYKELNVYLTGSGGVSNYKDMYLKENGYSALNRSVTGNGSPPISLDLSQAVHGGEYADPLYYFRGRQQPDNQNPKSNSYVCDIDRMFLHSYWRDCFANRQQLFLIFVRAESTALGGAGEGTPAQQGGRAVALVWRDPGPPTGSDVEEREDIGYKPKRHPHKMRILFYRQFD